MTSDSGSRKSQDASLPQCWEDIKDETGFLTYHEYLETYRDAMGGHHERLIEYLQESRSRPGRVEFAGFCSLWDIFETGTLWSCFAGPLVDSDAFDINVLTALRNPNSDSILRVILLQPYEAFYTSLHPTLVDVFGLGLRIVPEFFEAYLARSRETQDRYGVLLGDRSRFLGGSVVTVARDYLPGMSKYPPVLLIMAEQFTFNRLEPVVFFPQKTWNSRWTQSVKTFENVVKSNLKHCQSQTIDLDVALLHSLLPLLKSCLKELKTSHDEVKDEYLGRFDLLSSISPSLRSGLKNPEDVMEASRFILRRKLRGFEDCMSNFKRILRDQHILNPEIYEAFTLLIDDSHATLNDASALESEIRDWLQLRVGSLALEESKKSIEASNLQIEESKRGKKMRFRFDVVIELTSHIYTQSRLVWMILVSL